MKKIFITQRVQIIDGYNERRDCLDQKWNELLMECGLLPVIIPNSLETVNNIIENIKPNGILLTGGNDLIRYGGDANERDQLEYMLIDYAITNDIPLLGVCRGMQIILDYFGVPLVKVKNHVTKSHTIKSSSEEKKVNSYHNFGALECSDELKVIFRSDDKVIEQIEHKDYNINGIMWHPERYYPFRSEDISFIRKVFNIERRK